MKTWMKILLGALIICLLVAIYVYKYVYNKPHPDYEKEVPAFVIKAEDLYKEFKVSNNIASPKYTGKVIEISGNLTRVDKADTLTICIFKFEDGMFGDQGIRCTILKDNIEKAKKLTPGAMVKIKGYCTGFNDTDVVFDKCSVVE